MPGKRGGKRPGAGRPRKDGAPKLTRKQTGRPTDYRPEFADQAAKLCALGATDADLANFFNVSGRTISNWKVLHERFLLALKVGKEVADAKVERSLFHRAVGYEQEAVKVFMPAGAKAPVYAPYTERVAPDTTAAIFWLKNRRPDLWRDVTRVEQTGEGGGPIETRALTADEVRERLKERGLPTSIFDR